MTKEAIKNYIIKANLKPVESVFKMNEERLTKVLELKNILLTRCEKRAVSKDLVCLRNNAEKEFPHSTTEGEAEATFIQQVLFEIDSKRCLPIKVEKLDKDNVIESVENCK